MVLARLRVIGFNLFGNPVLGLKVLRIDIDRSRLVRIADTHLFQVRFQRVPADHHHALAHKLLQQVLGQERPVLLRDHTGGNQSPAFQHFHKVFHFHGVQQGQGVLGHGGERLAGKDVCFRIFQLFPGNLAFPHLGQQVIHQLRPVADSASFGSQSALRRLHNTHDLYFHGVFQFASHILRVPGAVHPQCSRFGIHVRIQQHPEAHVHKFFIGELQVFRLYSHAAHQLIKLFFQLALVPEAQGIQGIVAQLIPAVQDNHHFVLRFRQASGQDRVLGLQQFIIVQQGREHVHPARGGIHHRFLDAGSRSHQAHHIRHTGGFHDRGRVDLDGCFQVRAVQQQRGIVFIADAGNIPLNVIGGIFQPGLEPGQVVLRHAAHPGAHQLGHAAAGIHLAVRPVLAFQVQVHESRHRIRHVHGALVYLQRIGGQGIPLHPLNIPVYAVGQAQDQRDTDDADRTGKGCQDRPAFLGHQVIQAQVQGRQETHGGFPLRSGPLFRLISSGAFSVRGAVTDNFAVEQFDNPGGILIRQFRIVGHHDDQPVFGHLAQDLHDLEAGFAVQRAGRFVRQQDFRIVDQRTGNRHPLHLAAAELVGLLLQLVPEADLFQRFHSPGTPLLPADAGKGQGQFHIGQHRLVRNQIIALENKTDGMVPVGIPVPLRKLLRGLSADDQVPGGITVQAADNIQQRGFSAAGRAQDRGKLTLAENQVNAPERFNLRVPGGVILDYIL